MRRDPVTRREAERAIYVDFEGLENKPPVLLGAHWVDDADESHLVQYVFEPGLRSAAEAKSEEEGGACRYVDSLAEALDEILQLANAEDRLLVEWSSHEEEVVLEDAEVSVALFLDFINRIRDAKVTAKRWKARRHRDVVFKPNERGRRHTLTNYMGLAGHPVPSYLRPAAARIRYVMAQLEKRGDYNLLTPVAKGKWSKLLSHNRSDCMGTRAVLLEACEDLAL